MRIQTSQLYLENHGSRFLKASFLGTVSEIQSAFLSAANKMQLKKNPKGRIVISNSSFALVSKFTSGP